MQGREIKFPLGQARIKVLSEGTSLLNKGARYRFEVPPDLAFGKKGAGALVPPDTATIWEIELVNVQKPMSVPEFSMSPAERLVTTESGLQYEVIKEGTGSSPETSSTVVVHYAGWLEDGTLFDSSYGRGDPATFNLRGVIKGWTEGIALMKEGAVYKFTIPSDLGYREQGSPPKIPPNATLIFHVELIEVK